MSGVNEKKKYKTFAIACDLKADYFRVMLDERVKTTELKHRILLLKKLKTIHSLHLKDSNTEQRKMHLEYRVF